jgi:hypothetical protein
VAKRSKQKTPVRLFISHSGLLSRQVAHALRNWLRLLFPALRPWVSSEDIGPGSRWTDEIARELQSATAGIVCLTNDNLESPWLHYEAGALSLLEKSAVMTLLVEAPPPSEIQGPLAQFHHTVWGREGVERIVRFIHEMLPEPGHDVRQFDQLFNTLWPNLSAEVEAAIMARRAQPTTIRLADIATDGTIACQSFQDAIIQGPALILPEHCTFQECGFGMPQPVDSMLWPLDATRGRAIVGAFLLVRCSFVRCRFMGVGITGAAPLLETFRREILTPGQSVAPGT